MKELYQLNKTLTFNRPRTWEVHTRYALLVHSEMMVVEKGSWLLELGSQLTWDEKTEYLYRLATGETVALKRPLSVADGEAHLVNSKQAVLAMNAFRTLEQAAFEDWGIHIEHIHHLSPFRLIKCPLCGQTEFTSLDFTSTWCHKCNAQFQVRYTAGDPGFVIDCIWSDLYYGATRLMLPRSEFLGMYLVFKDSGDPCDLSCDDCRCAPDKPSLTDQDDRSLRPGLHTCKIGDIYEWKLSGWAPDYIELKRRTQRSGWKIDGQWWPDCAYIRTTSLLDGELHALQRLCRYLSSVADADDLAVLSDLETLNRNLSTRLPRRPMVYGGLGGNFIPDMTELGEEERYLLHHWLLTKDDGSLETAWPVWYAVKPILGEEQKHTQLCPIEGWEVIRKDICPCCTRPVTGKDMTANALNALRGKTISRSQHQHCRKVWEESGWQPYEEVLATANT